jgi:aminocarboxymuconate-semialdehyde decarboxylase
MATTSTTGLGDSDDVEGHARPGAVDVHAHLFPQSAVRAEERGGEWFGSTFENVPPDAPPVIVTGGSRLPMGSAVHREPPETRLERMDLAGVATQVISLLPPLFRYDLPPDVAAAAARAVNDEIAGMRRSWPGRFLGLATLPLQDPVAALDELERAMGLGLSGFAIGTHVAGRDLDDPALRPVFRLAGRLGCFVLCHPAHPRSGDAMRRFYLSNVVGNPWETTLAFTALVLGGVLDDAPGMRICFSHGGGYITTAIGRLGHAYRVRPEVTGSARPPAEYLESVYFDSLTHDPGGLADLVRKVGADHVLLGSDYPADMGEEDPVGAVRAAGLTASESDAVIGDNARRLLGSGGGGALRPAPRSGNMR